MSIVVTVLGEGAGLVKKYVRKQTHKKAIEVHANSLEGSLSMELQLYVPHRGMTEGHGLGTIYMYIKP